MPEMWYIDNSPEDPKSEHHFNPPQFIPIENLYDLTGVEYFRIDVDNLDKEEQYAELRKSRGYDYEDILEISTDTMPDYDEKIKAFYTEHLHEDEEIRLFLEGNGYFDVRDKNDRWIRIKVIEGDLLVLPAGIYHRFTPGNNNYAKIRRLFSETPVWKAYNRPADDNPIRKNA